MAALDSLKNRPAAKAAGTAAPLACLDVWDFLCDLGALGLAKARDFLAIASRGSLVEEVLAGIFFEVWAVVSDCADAALLQALSSSAKAKADQYGWVFRGRMRGGCWNMRKQFKRRFAACLHDRNWGRTRDKLKLTKSHKHIEYFESMTWSFGAKTACMSVGAPFTCTRFPDVHFGRWGQAAHLTATGVPPSVLVASRLGAKLSHGMASRCSR
jgi:hypothetical protein